MITITEKAVDKINEIMATEGQEGKGLRIYVEGGGCSGFMYGFEFDESREGDSVLPQRGFELLVNSMSADHLTGSMVDYEDGLSGSGFRVKNPNATGTCGCGQSFCG